MSYNSFYPGYSSYPYYRYGYENRYGSNYRNRNSFGYNSGYGNGYRYGRDTSSNSVNSSFYNRRLTGYGRRRPYYWERDSWYDNYNRYRTRTPSPPTVETPPPTPPPEIPEEELVRELSVKNVELNIGDNTKKHNTDEYSCTQRSSDPELVVRRGDTIKITITFDRPYRERKNDVKLCFSMGKTPSVSKGTLNMFDIDESGEGKFAWNKWGANLDDKNDKKFEITVLIHVPANCIVGEWDFYVKTISKGKNKEGALETIQSEEFHIRDDLTILFNPWCKDDPVYMQDEESREEYVLNESGGVWRGSYDNFSAKPWNYGQFEDQILDASFEIIRRGFGGDKLKPMSDPVLVSRIISKMVNSNRDEGVISGRWSDNYDGGEVPWSWVGSLKILRKWLNNNRRPVKYGQCWVFACVTTTVCRALGIPCRTVTNFESAHDTNGSNTVETYFELGPDGFDVKVEGHRENDSIWNFHVWNEVWMKRDDLSEFTDHGWQVIDATPQELSGGDMQCGPCPVRAIKNGVCTTKYDCGFIFTEVNGDEVHWKTHPDGSEERLRIIKDSVGKRISTKKPGNTNERLDITNEYKYEEGSQEERKAVMKAHETARFPDPDTYANVEKVKPIEFELELRDDIMIGSVMPIKLVATNKASQDRTINEGVIIVSQAAYTGFTGKEIHKEKFGPVTLKAGEEKVFTVNLHPDQYLDYLIELANVAIVTEGHVEPIGYNYDNEFYLKRPSRFRRPDLEVKGPKEANVGDVVKFNVTLVNPLNKPLTKCKVSMESVGFDDFDLKAIDDIKPKEVWKMEFPLKAVKAARYSAVYFSFECGEIPDISGFSVIKIFK